MELLLWEIFNPGFYIFNNKRLSENAEIETFFVLNSETWQFSIKANVCNHWHWHNLFKPAYNFPQEMRNGLRWWNWMLNSNPWACPKYVDWKYQPRPTQPLLSSVDVFTNLFFGILQVSTYAGLHIFECSLCTFSSALRQHKWFYIDTYLPFRW